MTIIMFMVTQFNNSIEEAKEFAKSYYENCNIV